LAGCAHAGTLLHGACNKRRSGLKHSRVPPS
jgi:hypothetical protein